MSYIGLLVGNPSLLSVVIVSVIFVLALGLFLSGKFGSKQPSKNPFATDTARPPKQVVADQNVRDKVLKQGFTASKVPENLDAVIIGSGIGGLTVGATMAKAGKKVLLLEQHDQAGGCCHTFIEKGFEFDVGIHYCGELGDGTLTKLAIDQLTDGQLVWEQVDEIYDQVIISDSNGGKRRTYDMKSGKREVFRENLVRQFPEEVKAIDKFMALLKDNKNQFSRGILLKIIPKWISRILISTGIVHLITSHYRGAKKTLDEVLEGITTNKDLRTVFSYCFGDFGTPPDKCPFFMQACLMNHFMRGGYYPRGGASEIAFHMIPVIEAAGGKCLVRAPVSEIVLDKEGKATGVVVRKGGNNITINAPMVISGAGVFNTAKMLSPKVAPSVTKVVERKEGFQHGYGGFSLFVGLNGTSEELGLPKRQNWYFTSNELSKTFWEYMNLSTEEAMEKSVPLVFISFPSAKDSSWNERHPGKAVCTVVTMANWEWFQPWEEERVKNRGDGYESVKDAIAKNMWKRVLDLYPQLEDKVEYFEAGSPVTNKYYLAAQKGEMYGLDHNKERFSAKAALALHPSSRVPNLYLTGQDVMTCGFSGGLYGGLFTACHTLNRNVLLDLISLKKKVKKAKSKKN
ncbi:All-trans-retinol 13,14-reductase [Holothuria leucospilota]|uniref:All-trans-retinol 13,14-reductase n=1 Tax=Holothuria leucospilota TaxID=206669 RepID=A0A9Q0YN78_HOLLE|nr:All-trans-retinol 13,14-reductase [Holothuria leucospilota]